MSVQLYTSAEVADLLKLNPQVVQRKLQAGEIPGYRIGREWRVSHDQLMAWLEEHSNQRLPRSPEAKVTATFFAPDGRLRSIPAQRKKREVVLTRIAASFEPGRTYREREVNEILRRFHDDVASLRREMVVMKLLSRTRNGVYKRHAPTEPALRRG